MKKSILVIFSFFLTNLAMGQDFDLSASIERGKSIYSSKCASCHMADGTGIRGIYTPLTGADSLINDKTRLVKSILVGVKGPTVVNGIKYDGEMQSYSLTDKQVADVLNYIRNSWGNKGEAILADEIQSLLTNKNNEN